MENSPRLKNFVAVSLLLFGFCAQLRAQEASSPDLHA